MYGFKNDNAHDGRSNNSTYLNLLKHRICTDHMIIDVITASWRNTPIDFIRIFQCSTIQSIRKAPWSAEAAVPFKHFFQQNIDCQCIAPWEWGWSDLNIGSSLPRVWCSERTSAVDLVELKNQPTPLCLHSFLSCVLDTMPNNQLCMNRWDRRYTCQRSGRYIYLYIVWRDTSYPHHDRRHAVIVHVHRSLKHRPWLVLDFWERCWHLSSPPDVHCRGREWVINLGGL